MPKRTYAVLGGTGNVGHVLTEELLQRGHAVTVLGRDTKKLEALKAKGAAVLVVDALDSAALAGAFRGADAVFTMTPPAFHLEDYETYQDQVGEAVAAAVRQSGVARVMDLSSVGAQHREGHGPVAGLHRQERRLEKIPGLNLLHLRANFFMENNFYTISTIKGMGMNGSTLRPDVPIAMVASRDIGKKAAELLDRLDFQGHGVHELSGPREVTMNEATAVLGKAIGRPDLRYVQFPEPDAERALLGMGIPPKSVKLMLELYRGVNEGRVQTVQPAGPERRGATTIEEFAPVFAHAYQAN